VGRSSAGAFGCFRYSNSLAGLARRVAIYVDRILQGTKPVDLPVEEPMQCELAFHLKTAKEMGVTMPPHVLARVDRVSKRP
jgi:putative ABC transport system substrate-binding protein